MYNSESIGIGIVTCNRKDSYSRLFKQVISNFDVDDIITVKNKDYDYGDDDPLKLLNQTDKASYVHVPDDFGVGFCKNICLRYLVEKQCNHIFLIEDDISIKDPDVFKKYIDTAKAYKLDHLNFCMAWDSITKKWLLPSYSISNKDGMKLSVFNRLCGDFEYFTRDVILQVGMFDAKHYVNAMEHAEHTYRIASAGYTLPFHAFADVYQSDQLLEDTGIESSIHHDENSTMIYKQRIAAASQHFIKTYGRSIGQLQRPSPEEVQRFLITKGNENR